MSRTSSGFGGLAALRASLPAASVAAPAAPAAPLYGGAPPLTWEEAWGLTRAGLPHVADIRHVLSGEEAHAAASATNAAARAAKWREEAEGPDRADFLKEAADLLMAASASYHSAEAELEEARTQETAALAAVPEMKAAWNAMVRVPRTISSKYSSGADRDNPAWLEAVRQYAVPHGWVKAAEAASRTARVAAQEARAEGARLEYKAACVYAASQGRGGQIVD